MYRYYDYNSKEGKRHMLMRIASDLKEDRTSFDTIYMDISSQISPTRSRFYVEDFTNNSWRYNSEILDSSPVRASQILKSGMLSGITPPSRAWFELGVRNKNITQSGAVRQWLDECTQIMRDTFLKTNFYEQLQTLYADLGDYGTSAMFVERDVDRVMTFSTQPIGSFYIGVNDKFKIDKYYREYVMTVRQIVNKFARDEMTGEYDFSNCSEYIKDSFMNGRHQQKVIVGHIVMPNHEFNPTKKLSKFKKYASFYFELGALGTKDGAQYEIRADQILSQRGYDLFPILAPRWESVGEEPYGSNSCGMTALGDAFQLQEGEHKTLTALDKTIDPPTVGPPSLKNQKTSNLPGTTTYVEEQHIGQYRAVYSINYNISAMEQKQAQVRERIREAYYVDLFLSILKSDRRQMTATEVEERHEEKLIALGPVLENLNSDLLDPLIDIAFYHMDDAGLIPDPPKELQGQELKVNYISMMAHAQKSIGLAALDRTWGFVNQVAQVDPTAVDKINIPNLIDEYADITGAPAKIIRSNEEVEAIAAQRAQIEQQQMQAEQAEAASKAVKNVGAIDEQAAQDMLTKMG